MKKYYLRNDFPIKTNCPEPEDIKISKQEYKQICKERNDQVAADQTKQEEALQPVRERQALIIQKALEDAEKELIKEGILNA